MYYNQKSNKRLLLIRKIVKLLQGVNDFVTVSFVPCNCTIRVALKNHKWWSLFSTKNKVIVNKLLAINSNLFKNIRLYSTSIDVSRKCFPLISRCHLRLLDSALSSNVTGCWDWLHFKSSKPLQYCSSLLTLKINHNNKLPFWCKQAQFKMK